MNKRMKPIVSWGLWAGGLSLVMGVVTRKYLLEGFRSDETGMSLVIAALFVAGLAVSFIAARQLHSEWGVLKDISDTNKIPAGKGNDLASVFSKLADHKRKGDAVDIHAAVETYHARHNSRVRSVSIMAALVISMGLLGTVVGLIMSISGLGAMVENIGLSRVTMMEALKATVAGMGTAFYTTFFGALGGLILRAVAVSQLNSLSELCTAAAEYADVYLTARMDNKEEEINQSVSKVVASLENMQKEIETISGKLTVSFETTMKSFGDSLAEAGGHAMVATKESICGMTEQMNSFGSAIGGSFVAFNESIEKAGEEIRSSIGVVNTSIEKSGEELQSTFGELNTTIGKAGEGVTESFDSLNGSVSEAGDTVAGSLADFKLSIDGTTLELKDAVGELHTAINQATGQMVTMAQAKLDTEATEIAAHLSVAASSIEQFLKKKKPVESNQKVA